MEPSGPLQEEWRFSSLTRNAWNHIHQNYMVDVMPVYDWGLSKITKKCLEQGGVRRHALEVVQSRGPGVMYWRLSQSVLRNL